MLGFPLDNVPVGSLDVESQVSIREIFGFFRETDQIVYSFIGVLCGGRDIRNVFVIRTSHQNQKKEKEKKIICLHI